MPHGCGEILIDRSRAPEARPGHIAVRLREVNMDSAFRSWFRLILNIKPWGWAVAYLAAFFIYGIGYLILSHYEPHSFYQPNAPLERRYQTEQDDVSKKLLEDLREMFGYGSERR